MPQHLRLPPEPKSLDYFSRKTRLKDRGLVSRGIQILDWVGASRKISLRHGSQGNVVLERVQNTKAGRLRRLCDKESSSRLRPIGHRILTISRLDKEATKQDGQMRRSNL